MSSQAPYTIHVPDASIEKLKRKLEDADYPDELESDDQWRYGAPLSDVKRLAEHWRTGFDWRKVEAELNALPNYREKSPSRRLRRQLTCTSCGRRATSEAQSLCYSVMGPDSFLEVTKVLPLLKGGTASPAFHIIAPSLPNFGFSQQILKPGFALEQYAQRCHRLMLDLGYEMYVTKGGDWGFYVTRVMGILYPEQATST